MVNPLAISDLQEYRRLLVKRALMGPNGIIGDLLSQFDTHIAWNIVLYLQICRKASGQGNKR